MDFVNAGLVSAYVVRDSQPRALAATGPAIGVIPEASYVAQSLVLQPGDQLVLATDGLVEARAPSREFIGEDRLESWVRAESNTRSAQAIVDGLVERLREFTGNKLDDDLAVIALVSKKR
jgi:sigma-B regulation protein RsbU (phosphoserine phosphatase)